ncbi:MAG: PH domain-containing protein [Parabacteroides sp.]|nr:PH domain-containing protein [Parabacteroides sp.]
MDRVFKSKIGWWYHLLVIMLAIVCVVSVLHQNVMAIVLSLVASALVLHIFFNTYYVVTANGMLLLRFGFFPKKEIAIADIEALQPSILPVFSYSLSLDRIVIWKEGKMWMLISPQNEREFVKLLKKFNPDIEIRSNAGLL